VAGSVHQKSDEQEAKQFARQEYAKQQVLIEHGLDKKKRGVSEVSAIYYQSLHDRMSSGSGKPIFERYMAIVRNYIDVIAGKWPISEVTNERIAEYEKQVTEMMGRVPSKGTINQHNIVWRQLFKMARDKKWCSANDVPELTIKDKGRQTESRPELSLDDYKVLCRFLRTYHKATPKYSVRFKRQVLREYCAFLVATGMRPGEEPLGLRWMHINQEGGHIVVNVPDGKTGTRPVIAMSMIKPAIRRLKALTNHSDDEDLVFCNPDGSPLKDMSGMVGRLLTDAGLRVNSVGKNRTAYSLRHTYATFNIRYRGLNSDDLAKNMGTGVLMIDKHYSHVTPLDIADRLATGRTRQSTTERKVDYIHEMLKSKFSQEMRDVVVGFLEDNEFEDDYIAIRAVEIEMEKWEMAPSTRDRPTNENMDFIMEAAINRYSQFTEGEAFS
jgi:integrase